MRGPVPLQLRAGGLGHLELLAPGRRHLVVFSLSLAPGRAELGVVRAALPRPGRGQTVPLAARHVAAVARAGEAERRGGARLHGARLGPVEAEPLVEQVAGVRPAVGRAEDGRGRHGAGRQLRVRHGRGDAAAGLGRGGAGPEGLHQAVAVPLDGAGVGGRGPGPGARPRTVTARPVDSIHPAVGKSLNLKTELMSVRPLLGWAGLGCSGGTFTGLTAADCSVAKTSLTYFPELGPVFASALIEFCLIAECKLVIRSHLTSLSTPADTAIYTPGAPLRCGGRSLCGPGGGRRPLCT